MMGKALRSLLKNIVGALAMLALSCFASRALAQGSGSQHPYASIASTKVLYTGPGREASFDLKGPVIHIGVLAPLHGPQKAAGNAIVAAARLAIADASKAPFPGGRHVELAVGDESGPSWGHASSSLISLVFDQQAVAVITSASGSLAHLSEQVGNRIGVPILTLSSDSTTTEIDLPWIFRMGPSDDVQAGAFAQDIYRRRGFKRVVVISTRDHDGRVGSKAFEQAAQSLGASHPTSVQMDPLRPDYDILLALIMSKSPQAVVVWTRSEVARNLVRLLREHDVRAAVYLTQQASQVFRGSGSVAASGASSNAGIWTLASKPAPNPARRSFVQRYQAATGRPPSPTAAEAYDAVRLLASAVRAAGPNRARVRDQIAAARQVAGVSGDITFDSQGNNLAGIEVVRLQ